MRFALSGGRGRSGQQRAAFFGEDAFDDFDAVVERGMVHDGEHGAAGAGFGVAGGEDQAGDARVEDGAGAHGAGFERAVERAAGEAVVAERAAGGAQGDDFGVGGGVVGAETWLLPRR